MCCHFVPRTIRRLFLGYKQFLDNVASTDALKPSDSGLRITCIAFNSVGELKEVTILDIKGFTESPNLLYRSVKMTKVGVEQNDFP